MKVRRIYLMMLCLMVLHAMGQNTHFNVIGTVKDSEGRPIDLATIILNNELVGYSAQDGSFGFAKIPKGTYTYQISYVGFETMTGTLNVNKEKTKLDVVLKELGLQLQDIVVTAKQIALGSKSVIDQNAVRHIQPKSVTDILQLVPGHLSVNPSLNNLSQAHIREMDQNPNNAMGTAVVVDGVPVSNDGNMQALSTSRYGNASSGNADGMSNQTTAGKGTDLRTVSAGNIESVEVIRGIPSVEYGNLTSGLVVVKTKSGRTPWEVKLQADPFSKLAYAGKGFLLKQGGAINFSVDWSQSWSDTRRHYLGYDRITGTAGYSNRFGKLLLNVKGAFYSNINNRKQDPQHLEQELQYTNKNIGGRISVNGSYKDANGLITGLDYNFSAQLSQTVDKHHNLIPNPDGVITNARITGLFPATFKNRSYYSDYRIEGKPLNLYGQLVANKYIQLSEHSYTALKLGIEFKHDANHGAGLTFDMNNPPNATGAQSLRPRVYKDIPSLNTLSGFLSDRFAGTLAGMRIQVEAGLRMSNMFLKSSKSGGRSNFFVAEPRINASLAILNSANNDMLDDLSITGGFGIANKMPPLLYLYPDNVYYDHVSLSKYGDTESDRLALLTTTVIEDTQNSSLKPANSRKWELGLSFAIGKVKGFVTYYNELHKHEFGFDSQLHWANYYRFEVPVAATNPIFDATTSEVSYTLNGKNYTAEKTPLTEMLTWSRPANNTLSHKHGIEYGIDFGMLKFLRTTLSINGAWFHTKRIAETPHLSYIDRTYDYVAVMPEGRGTIRDRFNTTFRFVTHLPAVKMIFTTSAQVVWYESTKMTYEDAHGNNRYHRYKHQDRDFYAVNPVGYYNRQQQYEVWHAALENDAVKSRMINRYMLYAFEKDVVSPWVLLNFRFTKEIGKVAELSFVANNFPNMSKWHTNKHSMSKSQIYPESYFGAEVKIKL